MYFVAYLDSHLCLEWLLLKQNHVKRLMSEYERDHSNMRELTKI